MRKQLATTIDVETSAMIDQVCATHGLSRSQFVRGAIDRMLLETTDPWILGYAEGLRAGHADVQPVLRELLDSMRSSALAANAYADRVRLEAMSRSAPR